MVKKKTFVISLIIFVLVFVLLNFATIYFFSLPLSPVALTGKAVDVGYVRLYVEGDEKVITIYSPENITYDSASYTCATGSLPKCDNYRYILPLNVSADFYLENDSAWKYSLYDLRHGVYIGEDIPFTPNTSVPFVRWGNLLTVFAEEEDGDWINESVVFTIDVLNSAPLIQNFSEKIFVCEGQSMNSLPESYFNVWDIDEEDFSSSANYNIDGEGLFGIVSMSKTSNYITPLRIISVSFDKTQIGNYIKDISVFDSEGLSDSNTTNITVIEVNNVPVINNPEDFGSETIWMSGENSVFSRQLIVSDAEDGGSNDGNLIFNLTGQLDFVFNSSTGNISYVPQEGDEGKTYSGEICVIDRSLSLVHENFSICSDRGYTSESISVCDSFTLTITNENRAPSIDSYSPVLTSFNVSGTTENLFSVEVSDADMSEGFYPDIDWYVDGVLVESNENMARDDFSYTFGCGISGVHNVTIVTSDGLANDSVTWNINVINVDCPVEVERSSGGGGGGGGGTLGGVCNEQWSCLTWGLCQNAERSFDAGILSPEDYASTKDMCAQNMYDDRFCGFQITKCFDLNLCNNSEIRVPKPVESRVCYFTENPNCIDGITNCHDGGCELLVDCGGPCDACPTCSDGKRNQGENGIDCGGPCPYACEAESAFGSISILLILLLIILLIVAVFIIWKFISILRYRFFLSGKKKKR